MNELEYQSTEYHYSHEMELALKSGDIDRAVYWIHRWSELREAFPEYATSRR